MKKLLTITIVLFFSTSLLFAQSEKYTAAMSTVLEDFNVSQNKEPVRDEWLDLANRFERIASAEPKEWLPRYYAAYAYSSLAFMGNDAVQKDQMTDKAAGFLNEAVNLAGENSELMVLDAQIHQARLATDPQTRWQTEGPLFAASLDKAKKMDPNNPRTYLLEGTNLLYTPEQFGGGKKVAQPVLEKAMEKFSTFKPQGSLYPNWGQGQAGYMLGEANK